MLTKRERQILEAIIAYIAKHKYVPTVREISDEVGLSSASTTHVHLVNLEEKGYIFRGKDTPRAIRVLKDCYE